MAATKKTQTNAEKKKKTARALPGKGKAKGKAKKATAKEVSKAQEDLVEEDNNKVFDNAVVVKPTKCYTEEEDLFLCKAVVNVSTDPCVGVFQKGDVYWKRVHEKMYFMIDEDEDITIATKRPWQSVRNRFQKTIHPRVQIFNGYYKQVLEKEQSGWTKEMYIEAAKKLWFDEFKSHFKWGDCIRVLHDMAKYLPMAGTNETEAAVNADGETEGSNRMMGDTLVRPTGTKKAKRQKLLGSLASAPVASAVHQETMSMLAKNSAFMSVVMDRKQRHDTLIELAKLHASMGEVEQAKAIMKKLAEEAMAPHPAATVPPPIVSTRGVSNPSPLTLNGTGDYRLATGAAVMPSIQDAATDEDDSSHPSQENDSALVKPFPYQV